MKRLRILLLVLTLLQSLVALPTGAGQAAGEAADLTAACDIKVSTKAFSMERLRDRDWRTLWMGEDWGKVVTIKSPQPIYGLYINFAEDPRAWLIEEKQSDGWQPLPQAESPFQHQYIPLSGTREIRLTPATKNAKWFVISELFVLGEGTVPAYVQRWQQPEEACDLLLLFAHPDDEVLFFGGTLPTYAGERGYNVVAASLTPSTGKRRSELLNSLWSLGVSNYPVFGIVYDSHSNRLPTAYQKAGGEAKVHRWAVELLRRYKPQVVISHDTGGEYGHGQHKLAADAMLTAFDLAALPDKYKESAQQYGIWQVQKLYLHLYPENTLEMDWDIPLSAFAGRTGFEMAQQGYLFHQSQQHLEQFQVEPRQSPHSSYRFGLARSMVGPDIQKNDFFEHLAPSAFVVQSE